MSCIVKNVDIAAKHKYGSLAKLTCRKAGEMRDYGAKGKEELGLIGAKSFRRW